MSLRRAAATTGPKLLLRSGNGAQHSAVAGGAALGHVMTYGTYGGGLNFASSNAVRAVTTFSRLLDKAGDAPDDGGAAARRAAV